eukprot:gene2404-2552_t
MLFRIALFFLLLCFSAAFVPSAKVVRQTRLEMNLGTRVATVAIIGTALAGPSTTFAADVEAGSLVFAGNCAACHAGGNNVIQNEKTLRKEALEQYLDGGLSEKSIVNQVTNGKNAMPAFGGRLDDDQIANVAAYVYDQATNNKWD